MSAGLHLTGRLSPRDAWTADRCTIAKSLDVISTRSAFLILREAFYGTTRFDDFVTHTRLTTAVVSSRLKTLLCQAKSERARPVVWVSMARSVTFASASGSRNLK